MGVGSEQEEVQRHDVLVVGLGPVGSTAANLAGSLGLDCVGVDLSPQVFGLPRAIHFDADVMRIFQAVGLADAVSDICRPGSGSLHLGADGEPIRDFRVVGATGEQGWNPHYMFYQPELDQLLRDGAAARPGVQLLLGWGCERLGQDGDGVVATLRHPSGERREVRARYLIGCDGASSTVRRQIGVKLHDFGFEEAWIVVDMRVGSADLGPDHFVTRCDPQRPLVYAPGPGNHRRWEFMVLPGEDPEEMSRPARMREIIEPTAPWLGEPEVVRSAVYTFHGLVAESWSDGAVFLAGDAAHQTPPFYAQGMCHGIRDVRNLLWKLAAVIRGDAERSLLDTYEAERVPHVDAIIEAAVENGRYICMLDPELAARRDASYRKMMAEATDVGSFRGVIPGLGAGLLDDRAPRSTAVGQVFPQPLVRDRDGRPRLLDELLGPGFSLVAAGEAPSPAAAGLLEEIGATTVVDEDGLLGPWFEEHGCEWALVRPDRYLFGTAAEPLELEALIARLGEMLRGERSFARSAGEEGELVARRG